MLLEIFDPKAKPRAIGIDLGTTNSLVAYVRDGIPTTIALQPIDRYAQCRALQRSRPGHRRQCSFGAGGRESFRHHRECEAVHGRVIVRTANERVTAFTRLCQVLN